MASRSRTEFLAAQPATQDLPDASPCPSLALSHPSLVVRVGRGGAQNGALSTDGGHTRNGFKGQPVPGADSGHIAIAADGSSFVWAEAGQAPYRSTDRGASRLRINDDAH